MTNEEEEEESLRRFKESARKTIEGIHDSGMFMNIFHPSMQDLADDPMPALQLGAAILMNKPIVIVRRKDLGEIPDKLRRVADEILMLEDAKELESEETQERFAAAFERLVKKYDLHD